ncbi:hypothetical protein ACIP2X_20120 [Streptomyces sp. NPDC089424]|uniref:hypothetical protein n=1 Tax=Streptomyces sp. NPDC089424 TaxID=3365917 RepID=UPI00382AA56A
MRGAWSAWSTRSPRRRGALLGAAAALVCTGGLLATCGGGDEGEGYVAVGPAGGPPRAPGTSGAPPDGVTLVPLDGTGTPAGTAQGRDSPGSHEDPAAGAPAAPDRRPGGTSPSPEASTPADDSRTAPSTDAGTDTSTGTGTGGTTTEPPAPTPTRPGSPSPAPGPPPPPGPAEVSMGTPVRAPADQRWCQRVTVAFHNTGETAVRSGTVTFGTHVVGALGIDWATIESAEALPAPIAAGARKERTWTVCVDAWRVPLGMHVETRDVSVRWE